MDFGIASVAAITVIAYLVGIGCKASGSVKDELIPVICGCVGAVLGIAGLYLMPDFPATGCHQCSCSRHCVRSCRDWCEPDLQAAHQDRCVRGGDPRISEAPSVKGSNVTFGSSGFKTRRAF
jgi:hypothetical protein